MVYYGMSMNPTFFGGDMYVLFIFGGLVEIPAGLLVFFLIDKIGRKPVLVGGFFISSLCVLSSLLTGRESSIIFFYY